MRCFKCKDELTPDNNGMIINEGHVTELYLCNDCHYMEFGYNIYADLLYFKNKES